MDSSYIETVSIPQLTNLLSILLCLLQELFLIFALLPVVQEFHLVETHQICLFLRVINDSVPIHHFLLNFHLVVVFVLLVKKLLSFLFIAQIRFKLLHHFEVLFVLLLGLVCLLIYLFHLLVHLLHIFDVLIDLFSVLVDKCFIMFV